MHVYKSNSATSTEFGKVEKVHTTTPNIFKSPSVSSYRCLTVYIFNVIFTIGDFPFKIFQEKILFLHRSD